MAEHDNSYKLLFSEPKMVRDLLTGFIPEELVDQLDLQTLEPVRSSFVTDDLRDREDDIIWRVRRKERWVYVYLLVEFQSKVDYWMALRLLVYVGLLWQDLVRTKQVKRGQKLPPVLPIVLYRGKRPWTAAVDIADLVLPLPGGFDRFHPHSSYLLLEENRYSDEVLAGLQNVVAALFRLERNRTRERYGEVLKALGKWLRGPENESLRRAIIIWIKRVLWKSGIEIDIPATDNLEEAGSMMEQNLREIVRTGTRKGRQEGRQEGLQEGLQEGRREARQILIRQLERRFGPLDEKIRERVATANLESVMEWADRVLTAGRLEDVLA